MKIMKKSARGCSNIRITASAVCWRPLLLLLLLMLMCAAAAASTAAANYGTTIVVDRQLVQDDDDGDAQGNLCVDFSDGDLVSGLCNLLWVPLAFGIMLYCFVLQVLHSNVYDGFSTCTLVGPPVGRTSGSEALGSTTTDCIRSEEELRQEILQSSGTMTEIDLCPGTQIVLTEPFFDDGPDTAAGDVGVFSIHCSSSDDDSFVKFCFKSGISPSGATGGTLNVDTDCAIFQSDPNDPDCARN